MKKKLTLAVVSLVCFAMGTTWAQIKSVTADQAPPKPNAGHDYIKLMNETVSPAVGAVDITISTGAPAGREIGIPMAIGYDSNSTRHSGFMDNAGYLQQGGWRLVMPQLQYSFSVTPVLGPGGSTIINWCDTVDHYTFTDLAGTLHPLGIDQSPFDWLNCPGVDNWITRIMQDTDGVVIGTTSPMAQSVGPNPRSPAVTVFDHDGTLFTFSNLDGHTHGSGTYYSYTLDGTAPGVDPSNTVSSLPDFVETRNGNKVIFTDDSVGGGNSGASGAFHITDTLGRPLVTTSSFGINTAGSTDNITVSGFEQPYKLTWGTASFNYTIGGVLHQGVFPQFWSCGAGGGYGIGFGFGTHNGIAPVVTSIQLPNGLSYQFVYDNPNNENPYGLLRKVIYPNGAYVRYVWGLNPKATYSFEPPRNTPPSGQPNTRPPSGGEVCEYIFDSPAVSKRFVSFDGIHEVMEQDFAYSTTWTFSNVPGAPPMNGEYELWSQKKTTVTSTDLVTNSVSKTVYTYAPLFDIVGIQSDAIQMPVPPSHPGEIEIDYEDGAGKMLRTVKKTLTNEFFLPQDVLTTLDNGQSSLEHTSYNPTNVVTDTYDYDFGISIKDTIGAHGPLLRHIHADYTHVFPLNPLMPPVTSSNPYSTAISDRPSAVIVYDGTGIRLAETDYGYDETAVVPASATGHDDQNFGAGFNSGRGNATTKTAKCFVGAQACSAGDSVTHYTYDQTGQQITRTDPNGKIFTYSYADSFFDSNPPANAATPSGNTNAFLTRITAPTTGGISHISNFSYAFSDSSLTKSSDENGQVTTYIYENGFRRLAETDLPDGGQTKTTYNDAGANPSVVTTKKVTGALSIISTDILDGMGHTIQSQNNSDPAGVDYVDTAYDGFGRTFTVSNPHRSAAAPTDGVTQTQYDALGRLTLTTRQDGSTQTNSYYANCIVSIDEAGKSRRKCNDGIGRLVEVDEPTPGVSETTTATAATASISLSGTLQSTVLSNPATGTVSIIGTDSLVSGTSSYDFGTVTVFVGSASVNRPYGNSGSSPTSGSDLAAALCSAINTTSSTSTQVSCTATGSTMNLSAQAAGAAGNGITLGVSAQTQFPQSNQSAFSGSTTSGTLSGGGATLYDSGTTAITISAFGDTTTWFGSGTTTSNIATNLAAAINGDSTALVTASASGGTITLTAKATGLGSNLPLVCSSSYDTSHFSNPSFTISCPSALSGGHEAGSLSVPMLTLYTYDALGDLLQATQQGGTTDQTQWRIRNFTYDSLSHLLTATNPEAGRITYTYDPNGNVLQKVSPQSNQTGTATQTISYCYDALNRATGKAYSAQTCTNGQLPAGTAAITYAYDQGANAIGRVSSVTDQAGSGSYTYDPIGRIANEQRTIAGITKSMGYAYNSDGTIATATYPSNAVITYMPDAAGRPGKVQDLNNNINYVVGSGGTGTFASYGPDGALTGFLSGATGSFVGITNSFSYNNRLQPINMSAVAPNPNGVDATASDPISGSLSSATVLTTGNAPPAAAGSALTSFVPSDGSSHTFYLGTNQHLYHLFWNSTNSWQDQDISALANNVLAKAGSALTSFATSDGNYHVVYFDSNNHVNQLSSSGANWSNQDITAATGASAAAANSALTGYAGTYPAHIYYQGTNAHIYQFWLNGSTWVNSDLTASSGTSIVPASGTQLTSFVDSSGEHSFYLGQDNHFYQLFWNGAILANQDIMAMAALDLVDGPCAPDNGTCFYSNVSHMVGYGANGAYNFLTVTGNVACNVATFGDPAPGVTKACYLVNSFTVAAAGSKITSFSSSNGEHAYVLGGNRHIYHLYFDGANWHNEDETSFAGTSILAVSGSALSSFWMNDSSENLIYLGSNNHVYDMYYSDTTDWVNKDLTSLAGTSTTAATGSALTSFGLVAGNPGHVQYLASNGHVNHLYWNGSAWQNQDLTALASYASTVFDSGLVTLNIGTFAANACFGSSTNASCTGQPANNTAAQVVTALSNAINVPASPATATTNGATLNLTWKTGGNVTTAVSALATTHDQPSVFTTPSFTSSATSFSGGGPGTPVTVFSLNYDFHAGSGNNGNVFAITNNKDITRNQTFTYDALNRLITAQNAGTDCSATVLNGKTKFWGNSYGYDAWGNLLQKTVTKCSAENLGTLALINNQLSGYGYDAAGNTTSDPTDSVSATYDPENRIATATQSSIITSYVYDDEGNRVKKSSGSGGTLYWYTSLGVVAESDLSGNIQSEYVFFNGQRVARRDLPAGAVSYYFSDYLKTTDVVTDALGTIRNESDFNPWGGELQFVANDPNHYKFTGKERDTETGLDYFGARHYSNRLGRWMTADWSAAAEPVPYADFEDPQTLNLYSYVRNIPTVKTDIDGHCGDGDKPDPSCGSRYSKEDVAEIVFNEVGNLTEIGNGSGASLDDLYTNLTWSIFNGEKLPQQPANAGTGLPPGGKDSDVFQNIKKTVDCTCEDAKKGKPDPTNGADMFNNRHHGGGEDRTNVGTKGAHVPVIYQDGPYHQKGYKGRTWETYSRHKDIVMPKPPKKKKPPRRHRHNPPRPCIGCDGPPRPGHGSPNDLLLPMGGG